jgi:hypothetical protein
MPATKLRSLLDPDPNYEYGSVLPFAKERSTGNVSLAVPNLLRDPLQGMAGLFDEFTGAVEGEGFDPQRVTEGAMAMPAAGLLGTAPKGALAANALRRAAVRGLPEDVKVSDKAFNAALERGALDFEATPRSGGRTGYSVRISPKTKEGILPYGKGRRAGFYDPNYADIETLDPGDIIERQIAVPKSHVVEDIEALPDADTIYRGMSADEYDEFLKTNEIRSKGDYNMGGQDALTYWSTTPREAKSYASSFAPWQHKPTFERPAYVVAAKHPGAEHVRKVPGTGETEVGVARSISKDEIEAVWRGDVFDYTPGEYDLIPHQWDNEGREIALQLGGGAAPNPRLTWSQLNRDPTSGLLAPAQKKLDK